MTMILVVTHKEDYTADFVINKFNIQGIPYFRLNCEDLDKYSYSFSSNGKFQPHFEGIRFFSSVWYRRTKMPLVSLENASERLFIQTDFKSLLDNLIWTIPAKKWVSHPHDIIRAENKLYQLKIAQMFGMDIPETLVTSDIEQLKSFITQFNNGVIIKPIRHGKIVGGKEEKVIFTNKLDAETIRSLSQFSLTPCIFQEYISKQFELRVTVIGDKVFAAKVESQLNPTTVIDWRREQLLFEPYELPKVIEERCLHLTKYFKLNFSAIDLIKTPGGQYCFLELNPNGQWAWLEMESGIQMSGELIKYLM